MTRGSDSRQNTRLDVTVARSRTDIEATMRLRYLVFGEELGATIHDGAEGLERDDYDALCDHMLVRERASGKVIACSRILDGDRARSAGGFYSASEFEMDAVAALPGRIMELGRTCVHPGHRTGATISTLWSGLAQYIMD
ncbi:MAG TPA: GNAT family N-acetyltransferase, partial [Gammaproteobacteria bacterium]|nr:GNAT family N-acetyltransferase [Gammaproteobacteria bacterium]